MMFIVWVGRRAHQRAGRRHGAGRLPGDVTVCRGARAVGYGWSLIFANFAEAMAEGRGEAQANSLKGVKKTAFARKLREARYGAAMDHVPGR
ncbi:hypothetical protein ACNKHQ_03535 [Shigella flexneri]